MSSHSIPSKTQQIISVAVLGLLFTCSGLGQSQTNRPTSPPVTTRESANVRGRMVYSVKFPGGSALEFFNFLRTNGFAGDNILFAGGAANIYVPAFEVNHVRLKDIGKSVELVSEGKLEVEVVEKGEQSDENIWRVRASEQATGIRTKACAMPYLFRTAGAAKRIGQIVDATKQIVESFQVSAGRKTERGDAITIEAESIVIVVGSDAYVEAISSALEAAEKVAADGAKGK